MTTSSYYYVDLVVDLLHAGGFLRARPCGKIYFSLHSTLLLASHLPHHRCNFMNSFTASPSRSYQQAAMSSNSTTKRSSIAKSIAIVGSSGGGAATLGHTDPIDLLQSIQRELGRCSFFYSAGVDQQQQEQQGGDEEQQEVPRIHHALYVSVHSGRGLDGADDTTPATLYAMGCNSSSSDDKGPSVSTSSSSSSSSSGGLLQVRTVCTGPLHQVSTQARHLDTNYIAPSILHNQIHGLISISSDPLHVNYNSLKAASATQIPVTGSGGSSLSVAVSKLGVNLVGNAGGSVATTTYTRSVSYVCALVDAWGKAAEQDRSSNNIDTNDKGRWTYSPFRPSRAAGDGGAEDLAVRPHIGSVLDSCVPAFVAVCVTCRLLECMAHWLEIHSTIAYNDVNAKKDDSGSLHGIHHYQVLSLEHAMQIEAIIARLYWQLQFHSLPTVCSVISATAYAPELGPIVVMASGIASIVCGGSILAGLLAGVLVAYLSKRALFACIKLNIPATMTNVLVAGGVGAIVALGLGLSGMVSALAELGNAVRSLVRLLFLVPHPPQATPLPGLGFFIGIVFCYGSKVGWYHSIFLPIILLEMERGQASILGAVDECTLCLVSAGICLGNILTASLLSSDSDVAISKRGVKINLLCGDFIEAAYPFMDRSIIVNTFAYLASGVSTEILFHQRPEHVLSSAYLPFGLSIVLAHDIKRMSMACAAALGISFVGAVAGNVIASCANAKKDEKND